MGCRGQLLIVGPSTAGIFAREKEKFSKKVFNIVGANGPSGGDPKWSSTLPPAFWATPDPGSRTSPGPRPSYKTEEKGQRTGGARTQEERSVAGFRQPNHHHAHLGKSARHRCDPRAQRGKNQSTSGEKEKETDRGKQNIKMLKLKLTA